MNAVLAVVREAWRRVGGYGRRVRTIGVALVLVMMAFVALVARAAIVVGTITTPTPTSTASLTFSHTVPSGSDRALVVVTAHRDGNKNVNNITYGGVALTQAIQQNGNSNNNEVNIWYLVNPTVGTANVVVTLSGSVTVAASAINLTGVNQSTPVGTGVGAAATSTSPSVTVSSAANELVIGALSANGDAVSATSGGGQTSIVNTGSGTAGGDVRLAADSEAGAASVTMSWTLGASKAWGAAAVPFKPAAATYQISGTVFEDINYGGGAGRSLAGSGGSGVNGATVELYNGSGSYVSSATTAGGGTYSFTGLAAGTYYVRVASSTVPSQRSGTTGSLRGVLTYRTDAGSGTATAVTDYVGGINPALVDPGTASSGAAFNTSSGVFSAGPSGTAQVFAPVTLSSANIGNVDFGFNFDTVVNANDSGPGSLRQAITNANTLGGDASLAVSGRTAGIEHVVFMIGNGSSSAGLRSTTNYFSSGVATIAPLSALPSVSAALVIDGRTQPGWSSTPVVELNGSSAGTSTAGLSITAGGSTVAGLAINRFGGNGLALTTSGGNTVVGNHVGTNAAGTAASANGDNGIYITSGNNTIGGTAGSARNVISGNSSGGIEFNGAGATGNSVQGNYIGTNAAGAAALANGGYGIYVKSTATSNTIGAAVAGAGNVISGNTSNGVRLEGPTNTLLGNIIGLNASAGAKLANSIGVTVNGAAGSVIGGTTALAANTISGNTNDGVNLTGAGTTGTLVQGNWLGTNSGAASGLGNGRNGVYVLSSAGSNTIGGTATGAGNVMAGNTGRGVSVLNASTGNAVEGNSIYGNTQIGIDLGGDGITANDGAKTSGQPNLLMDTPVFTSATLSGSTLTVAGYVGSAASQSTFASARVEVFIADTTAAGNGQGQTYLGYLTADASGNFSGTVTGVSGITVGTTRITATATDTSNNTSEFSANQLVVTVGISGTVFEDVNYGGGAGRNQTTAVAAGGSVRSGATVELYTVSGSTATWSAATTTDASGNYSFTGLAAGNFAVRVLGATVSSSRTGYTASLLPVLSYRTDASGGTATAVTDHVGGFTPSATDGGSGAASTAFSTSTGVFSAGATGTAQAFALVTGSASNITGVDFGFNFDTVVNANDSGQGSLRQFLSNSNALSNTGLAQSGRTAGIDNAIFMIADGTARAGMNTGYPSLFTSGVATIAVGSALPTVTDPVVIDGQTQPGWSSAPIIEINGAGSGSGANGLSISAGGSTVRGLVINRFSGSSGVAGISLSGTGGNTVQGNYIGTNAAGTSALANYQGILVANANNTIGGTGATQANVVSGNTWRGILVDNTGGSAAGNTIRGNHVGTNAAGTAAIPNTIGIYLYQSPNNTIGGASAGQGNLVSGNSSIGIYLVYSGTTGNVVQGNTVGLNAARSGAVANGGAGIEICCGGNGATGNTIGDITAGTGNLISGNTGAGARMWGGTGNAVRGNSIYGNGSIGIDLGSNGITPNDGAKTGGVANLYMDAPVFTAARSRGSQLTASGYIGTAAGQSAFTGSRVEIFISDSTSANGSGKTYLGALTADASGNFSGTVTMPYSALRAGSVLTGTATDTANNTSEFGANFSGLVVDWLINHNGDGVDANPGDGLCETSTPGQCTLRAAIMETNAWAGADLAFFDLPSCPGAGCIITPASALPAITGPLTLDGQTQPGWTLAPLVDLRGEGAGAGSDGLTINADASIVRGLAVGGFLQSGIRINASNVTVEGVYAGLAPDGTTARANGASNSATGGVYVAGGTGIVIGGTTATTRNVLSGNGGAGVWANAGTATIIGNYVGTNAAGTAALGNGRWGVYLNAGTAHKVGGSATGEGNVISGNSANQKGGVYLVGSGYTVQGNTIGLNAARTAAVPNGDGSTNNAAGIDARSGSGHLIGGTGAGEGNVISGNQGHGVSVRSQTTRVLGNSLYNNLWLGIDLGADGVTANNGTASGSLPNNDVDHPVITSAGYDPGTRALTLTGFVGTGTGQAVFAGARVELFSSDGDATGYGEGSNFVGYLTSDANGRFSGSVTVPAAVTFSVGTALTGTATDTTNNTSEFGPNVVTTTMSALAPSRFNAFETGTAAGALTGVLQTRVAGVAGNIAVIAIDSSGTALQTSFAGTVTLEWMNASDNSGALDAGNCRSTWVAAGSAGSTSFVSGDLGRRNSSVTPTTVGREWRLRMSYVGPSGTVTSCATDAFAVRPDNLAITGVSDATDTTAGTTRALDNLAASGGRVHRAGRPFSLRAAARDAASAVATGYDGTPTLAITACVLPAGCSAGMLTVPSLMASAGLVAADTLSYSEVGAINVQLTDDGFADVDAADTPLAQRRIQSSAVGVGRFVPDRYLLAATNTAQFATQQGSCAASGQGFTFVGQNFGWAGAPAFNITAQNAAGGTTGLWSGSLQKVDAASHIARSLAASSAQGLTPVVSWAAMTLTDAGSGVANVALSGDQFLFTRDVSSPVASFNPLITLGIAVSDSSEVAVTGNTAIASVSALVIGSGSGIAFNLGSSFHYGRLKLQNAFGDVRRGVRANVELQKFSDRGWLRLSEDSSCISVPLAAIAFSAGSGAFGTDVCTAPATASMALRQGRGTLVLPKTAGNIQGAAMVTLNIGTTLEGNACAAGVPVSPTSAVWPHLLGARGSGSTQDQNPAARLVWGRQHRDYMVLRELF